MANPDELSTNMTPDDVQFQNFLKAGPSAAPSLIPNLTPPEAKEAEPVINEEALKRDLEEKVDEEKEKTPEMELRGRTYLPSEKEIQQLKARWQGLKVVPVPYDRTDGLYQGYILRPLTRGEWDVMMKDSAKIAESKPHVDPDLILAEKIVQKSLCWPNLREDLYIAQKAGLVPSLFGVVQQISLFFDPSALAQMMFEL